MIEAKTQSSPRESVLKTAGVCWIIGSIITVALIAYGFICDYLLDSILLRVPTMPLMFCGILQLALVCSIKMWNKSNSSVLICLSISKAIFTLGYLNFTSAVMEYTATSLLCIQIYGIFTIALWLVESMACWKVNKNIDKCYCATNIANYRLIKMNLNDYAGVVMLSLLYFFVSLVADCGSLINSYNIIDFFVLHYGVFVVLSLVSFLVIANVKKWSKGLFVSLIVLAAVKNIVTIIFAWTSSYGATIFNFASAVNVLHFVLVVIVTVILIGLFACDVIVLMRANRKAASENQCDN